MTRDEVKQLLSAYDRITKYYPNHIAVMREYANGASIQYESGDAWVDVAAPSFTSKDTYRVRPTLITAMGWVCIRDHLGYKVGNIIGDGMVPLVPTNWKEFTTTVEV